MRLERADIVRAAIFDATPDRANISEKFRALEKVSRSARVLQSVQTDDIANGAAQPC